eukprot:scaffold1237_cov243-Pinguiococcus_pyrenoidosus.AAC.24
MDSVGGKSNSGPAAAESAASPEVGCGFRPFLLLLLHNLERDHPRGKVKSREDDHEEDGHFGAGQVAPGGQVPRVFGAAAADAHGRQIGAAGAAFRRPRQSKAAGSFVEGAAGAKTAVEHLGSRQGGLRARAERGGGATTRDREAAKLASTVARSTRDVQGEVAGAARACRVDGVAHGGHWRVSSAAAQHHLHRPDPSRHLHDGQGRCRTATV